MMNKEALEEVINYTEVCRIIRDTDLLKYKDREKLQLYLMNFRDNYKDLQQRIDKAIEWINKHIDTFEERNITIYDWNSLSNPKDLLEILGGKE